MKIFIIGGKGRMGRWFAEFCSSQGHDVTVNDVKGRLIGFKFEKNLEKGCGNSDIIILATPLGKTNIVYKKIIACETKATILDICSLKTPILETIKKGRRLGKRIASVHPMFGPDTELLTDKNVLVCNCGDKNSVKKAKNLFKGTNAKVIEIKLDEHDKLMSYVLGLAHLNNILFFNALKNSGISFETLKNVGGTTFNNQIEVARDVANDNPELYYEIQAMNRHTPELLEIMQKSFDELKRDISNKDMEKFIKIIMNGRHYFRGRRK
ncbi:MAG: prephenate dehydrogenase/arogenate dehydrogenase family protein [Thermoplasmata archaeon]